MRSRSSSQLIIDGKIKIKQDSEIERFTAGEAVFADGDVLPADDVVLAAGYQNMPESARALQIEAIEEGLIPR